LAEDFGRRLIRAVLIGLALAFLLPAGAIAQAVAIPPPSWTDLSPAERQILAPLAPPEWDKLDAQRRLKWRGIAQRYPRMTPTEQQRVQQQMRTWAQLTPQERAAAREQYKSMKALPPEKKQEVQQKWEQYQNLPPETKRELAAKPVPPPPATGATGSRRGVTPAPPQSPPSQLAPAPNPAPR
jgi:hypothetical protein